MDLFEVVVEERVSLELEVELDAVLEEDFEILLLEFRREWEEVLEVGVGCRDWWDEDASLPPDVLGQQQQ